MKITLPKASDITQQLVHPEVEKLENARDAILVQFQSFLKDLVANPSKYTYRDRWSDKLPYVDGCSRYEERLISMLNVELAALGYLAHQSHDGGGMYQTVVILWGTALEQHKHYAKEQEKRNLLGRGRGI